MEEKKVRNFELKKGDVILTEDDEDIAIVLKVLDEESNLVEVKSLITDGWVYLLYNNEICTLLPINSSYCVNISIYSNNNVFAREESYKCKIKDLETIYPFLYRSFFGDTTICFNLQKIHGLDFYTTTFRSVDYEDFEAYIEIKGINDTLFAFVNWVKPYIIELIKFEISKLL